MGMSEINYRIKYRKDNFEVEVQGDKEWVERKFQEMTSKEAIPFGQRRTEIEGMPATLGEFLSKKGSPKQHTDIIAAFAYWLFKIENMHSFNARDIEDCYDQTRKSKPRNVNDVINRNIRKNIFAEAREEKDGHKAWVITDTGEKYVENMK